MYDAAVIGWHVTARAADHRGDLQLEVEQLASRGHRDVVVWTVHGIGVGEVERGRFVPLLGDTGVITGQAGDALDVSLERHEVPDRGRIGHRRPQPHVGVAPDGARCG